MDKTEYPPESLSYVNDYNGWLSIYAVVCLQQRVRGARMRRVIIVGHYSGPRLKTDTRHSTLKTQCIWMGNPECGVWIQSVECRVSVMSLGAWPQTFDDYSVIYP